MLDANKFIDTNRSEPLKLTMRSPTPTTVDQIAAEKMKISERLAVPTIAQTMSASRCSATSGRGGSRSAMENYMRRRLRRTRTVRRPDPGSLKNAVYFALVRRAVLTANRSCNSDAAKRLHRSMQTPKTGRQKEAAEPGRRLTLYITFQRNGSRRPSRQLTDLRNELCPAV